MGPNGVVGCRTQSLSGRFFGNPTDLRPTDLFFNGTFGLIDKGSDGSRRTGIYARWLHGQ
jgi:hypothetical protein